MQTDTIAPSPELQGCYTQGDSYEEALENTKDAIRLHIEDRMGNKEDIPLIESISSDLFGSSSMSKRNPLS